MPDIPVFIINLPVDLERRERMLSQFAGISGFRPEVLRAVDGGGLPDNVCLYLTQNRSMSSRKGTIGCFLSHTNAWEHVAQIDESFAIVLEDDVDIRGLEQICRFKLPDDAEIVFLNDRMSPLPVENIVPDAELEKDIPIAEPIRHSLDRLNTCQMGGGGDGYLLTPLGARKLLAACTEDLYFGHVDGRLLRYATTEDDLEYFPEDTWIGYVVRRHHNPLRMPALGILRGYSISPALVWHRSSHSSRDARDAAQSAL